MHCRVTVKQDEDGVFVVTCPALPGCISQGNNREDALENIKDAVEGYLESLKKNGEAIPPPTQEYLVGQTDAHTILIYTHFLD